VISAQPLVDVRGLVKHYQSLRPLRIRELTIEAGDVVAISGLDAPAAEALVNLVTGGAVPDEGQIRLFGHDTRTIADADAWLRLLDAVGVISLRAVLIEAFTVLQNIATAFTLTVDPIDPRVVPQAGALAREAGLAADVVDVPVGDLPAGAKMRTHLARALALGPRLLLADHPSAAIRREDVAGFAADVGRVARGRNLAVLALTADDVFARALGGRHVHLDGATGELKPPGFLRRLQLRVKT
jgi:ABC-type lipoprotein export system ATPase subunit